MDGARSKYPCKPFPYKKFPFGYPCSCQNKIEQVEVKQLWKGKEPEPIRVEESKTVLTSGSVKYPPLKEKCFLPYFRSSSHSRRHRYNFTSKWQIQILNELERGKEELVCISPKMKDSYELLCNIKLCEPKPPVTIKLRKPFNPVYCVFCNKSLYTGGTIYDLHEVVPAIKRQSNDQDDDIAYRIGFRTRIVVHKSCFDEYLKRTITYLLEYNPNECSSRSSPTDRDESRV